MIVENDITMETFNTGFAGWKGILKDVIRLERSTKRRYSQVEGVPPAKFTAPFKLE